MCLVTIAWQQHSTLPLIVAANRDERFDRPADELGWWPHAPDIVGGRDIEAGGTWLAMHRNGRFGIVTNYREVPGTGATPRSRGELIVDWLNGTDTPDAYADQVITRGDDYAGFNLLYGDNDTLAYVSNRDTQPRTLAPGVYALSNGLLDSAWPKVTQARCAMRDALANEDIQPQHLMPFLCNTAQAPDNELPDEDFDIERRRLLSAPFIVGAQYGTRCSTFVARNHAGDVHIHEQHYAPGGARLHHIDQRFSVSSG